MKKREAVPFEDIKAIEYEIPAPDKKSVLDTEGKEIPQTRSIWQARFFGQVFSFTGDSPEEARSLAKAHYETLNYLDFDPSKYETTLNVYAGDELVGNMKVLEKNAKAQAKNLVKDGLVREAFGSHMLIIPNKIAYYVSQF